MESPTVGQASHADPQRADAPGVYGLERPPEPAIHIAHVTLPSGIERLPVWMRRLVERFPGQASHADPLRADAPKVYGLERPPEPAIHIAHVTLPSGIERLPVSMRRLVERLQRSG